MSHRDRLFLDHIRIALDDIAEFTVAGQASFADDRKTQSAVVRQLEIIGEAVENLSAALIARESGVPWRAIAGTRDRRIHAYFNMNLDAVWSMVEQDLPTLRRDIERDPLERR